MSRIAAHLIILSSIIKFVLAQSATTIADRIVWERDFPNLAVSTAGAAVADREGNLWAFSSLCLNRGICGGRQNETAAFWLAKNEVVWADMGGP